MDDSVTKKEKYSFSFLYHLICFQQEDGKWMYSGGEDCSARIWDLKMRNLSCQRAFQTNAPVNAACLHPNQQVVFQTNLNTTCTPNQHL